jgi:HNH endonuclease
MRETQFKKGQVSRNYLPIGTVRTDADGYLRRKIADGVGGFGNPKVWEFVHRRVWIEAHGPIPRGYRIWWKDGDHANCSLENLELLSGPEHMARTTIHTLPHALKEVIQLNGALKRKIRRRERVQEQNVEPSQSPIRNVGEAQGSRGAVGH